MNYKFLLLFFCLVIQVTAQTIPDSLLKKTDSELIRGYSNTKSKQIKELYALAYIEQGRTNKDTSSIADGFTLLHILFENDHHSIYADSIINYTEKNPNFNYPAGGYLLKGDRYFKQRKIKQALDNYLIAYDYAQKYFSAEIIFKSNNMIAYIKDRIGYSEEALQLHLKNLEFSKQYSNKLHTSFHINAIFAVANTYKNLKQLDSASYYNEIGLDMSRRIGNESQLNFFLLNEGIISYNQKSFSKAEKSIQKALKYFEKTEDNPNRAESYFYLAKLYLEYGQEDRSVDYLKKIDSIFIKTKDLLPEVREGYELLINHYKKKENPELQLTYLTRLISLDSILSVNKSFLSDKLKNKYDIPKLIEQKEALINRLEKDRINLTQVMISLFLVLVSIIFILYKRQKKFKRKFNALISKNQKPKQIKTSTQSIKNIVTIEVPKGIIDNILEQLLSFERQKSFTNNKITLTSLAKTYNTNSTYLSQVINQYHNKSFTNYINDLRIEYATEKLKNDPSFRKYTIKAIAQESGFKSAETFSKLFKKKNGIYPSYFIKQLNNVI